MAKYVVATVDEIPPGGRKVVEVARRSIGVFNIGGEYYALRNHCPHQGGPLCAGRLAGLLEAQIPGEYHYTRRGEILRCPWHGWEFDVKTGQSWFDPARMRVHAYPVAVEAGTHLVARDTQEEDADPPHGLQAGPYIAETFPVSVEQHYVVIEIRN